MPFCPQKSTTMKKLLIMNLTAMLAFAALPSFAQSSNNAAKDSGVASLLTRNREMKGLRMKSLGGVWIKMLGRLAGAGSEDPNVERILSGVGGINRILVVDFADCSESDRKEFISELEALISKSEKMFEGKDGGDTLGIYGIPDSGEGKVRDLIVRQRGGKTVVFAIGSATSAILSEILSADTV